MDTSSSARAIRASYRMAKGFLAEARQAMDAGNSTLATEMVRMARACRNNIARYRPTPEEIEVEAQLQAKGYRSPILGECGGLYVMVKVGGAWTQVRGIALGS